MTIAREDLTYVADLVRRRAAIVLDSSKDYLIIARLTPVAKRTGAGTVEALVKELRRTSWGPLHGQVIEALTTNETSFFRDFHPWEAMRTTVMPELIGARRTTRRLTIWCAACSSGQEPYTIAMLLRESFPELASWTIRIVATDISTQMVSRTTEGRYSEMEINRGLPPALRNKYFEPADRGFRARADLRKLIVPHLLNLAEPWPSLGAVDIVLLRNVLIYFAVDTRREILERVARLLPADGTLFLGAAETTVNITQSFIRAAVGPTSIYRPIKGAAAASVTPTGTRAAVPRPKQGAA